MSELVKNNIMSHIDLMLKRINFKQLCLSWFGGEPLLYFKKVIYPLSLYAKEQCISKDILFDNSITTNGFLINEKMISDFDRIDLRHFQITLDGDRNAHDANNVNEDVKSILENNERNLRMSGFNVSYNQHFSIYKGNVCYADRKNYAHINFDGNVYRCTARDYIPEAALGKLMDNGEIVWKEGAMKEVDSKAYFDNPVCIDCEYLPLCGGPCFQKALDAFNASQNVCVKDLLDSTFEEFVVNYHNSVKKYNSIMV